MSHYLKYLNFQNWSVDQVTEWLKGIRGINEIYVNNFKEKKINGKKLSLIDLNDIHDLVPSNLNQKILVYKSIQSLFYLKHDVQNDTLQSIIFKLVSKFKTMSNYVDKIQLCVNPECDLCTKLSCDLVKQTSQIAILYRKLITWLVRLPFTKMKKFELFRDDINFKMKNFFKILRKKLNENQYDDLKHILNDVLFNLNSMLEYFDSCCEKENGKVSVAFNYTYLEKVQLRKKYSNQELGISLISLMEGVYTIAEITRESAADECTKLNVEDDIIAINNQIVVGWDVMCLNQLLNEIFDLNSFVILLLRKMPKDHLISIKQQQQQQNKNKFCENVARKNSSNNQQSNKHQRKLSFSDIFLTDEYLLENSSDEESTDDDEDKEEADFNNNKTQSITENLNQLSSSVNDSKSESLYEKRPIKGFEKYFKKSSKLGYKSKANRLIKSMQNLLSYDRSRSNSTDSLSNIDTKGSSKKIKTNFLLNDSNSESSSKQDVTSVTGRSDPIRSLFMNKKWELGSSGSSLSKKNTLDTDSVDTPSLINIKRLDENYQTDFKVSSKPPLNKRAYKISLKPTMQSWLYIKKYNNLTGSNTNLSKINQTPVSKWKHYWCVLVKDYITFYKNQDDKTPKDYLLLKDFSVSRSETRKNGFILFDKIKQIEHEFSAESAELLKEWLQCLTDLRSRMTNEMSLSTTSLTSSFDNSLQDSISMPSSSSLSRKNNLNLNLGTIQDSNVDELGSLNSLQNSPPLTKPEQSPTTNQSFNMSSRESSPAKSRDSSPSLQYPYMQDLDSFMTTSESDAETRPLPEFIKSMIPKYNTQKSCPVNSSISATASAGVVKTNSPLSADSTVNHFDYDENKQSPESEQSHSRANSLPGSLQFCVGSLMDSSVPFQPSQILNKNLNLSSSPKSSSSNSSQPNSPNLPSRKSTLTPMDNEVPQAPKVFFYVKNNYQNYEQAKSQPTTRKISFQLGANGITLSQPAQQQQFLITKMTKPNQSVNIRKPTPLTQQASNSSNNNNSVLYRTEITILPSGNSSQSKQPPMQQYLNNSNQASSNSPTSSSNNKIIRF